jgi:hypothetical protein
MFPCSHGNISFGTPSDCPPSRECTHMGIKNAPSWKETHNNLMLAMLGIL